MTPLLYGCVPGVRVTGAPCETHLLMRLVHATVVVATGAERRQACGYAAEVERGSLQQSFFPRHGPRALKRAVRTWTAQPAAAAREA